MPWWGYLIAAGLAIAAVYVVGALVVMFRVAGGFKQFPKDW